MHNILSLAHNLLHWQQGDTFRYFSIKFIYFFISRMTDAQTEIICTVDCDDMKLQKGER